MTLIEAVKSGKRIKRSGWSGYYDTAGSFAVSEEDVLATDWELEVVSNSISASMVRLAVKSFNAKEAYEDRIYDFQVKGLLKGLGLE